MVRHEHIVFFCICIYGMLALMRETCAYFENVIFSIDIKDDIAKSEVRKSITEFENVLTYSMSKFLAFN